VVRDFKRQCEAGSCEFSKLQFREDARRQASCIGRDRLLRGNEHFEGETGEILHVSAEQVLVEFDGYEIENKTR
jgi:hypothetical protein